MRSADIDNQHKMLVKQTAEVTLRLQGPEADHPVIGYLLRRKAERLALAWRGR